MKLYKWVFYVGFVLYAIVSIYLFMFTSGGWRTISIGLLSAALYALILVVLLVTNVIISKPVVVTKTAF